MNTSNIFTNPQALKSHYFILFIFSLFLFFSCSPTIHYLGNNYRPTTKVDVYFDEKDIEQEYTTIGKMTHGNLFDYEMETIKNKMIEKAKAIGADGILFMEVKNVVDTDNNDFLDDDRLSITANVIRYK